MRAIPIDPIRRRVALLAGGFAGVLVVSPVLAQSVPGMPGGTVGLPANPFASNYPSEPPPRDVGPDRRDGAATGPRRAKRRQGGRPVPPADIPAR